jgi:hypothetical protein
MRRAVLIGFLGFLFAGVAPHGAHGPQPQPLTLTGWTRVATSDDQLTTVVTVIVGGTASPEQVWVHRAFRLQRRKPQSFEYEGPATVDYAANRLVIKTSDHAEWVFVVAGRATSEELKALPSPQFEVFGLSQLWGSSIQGTQQAVVARLLPAGCAASYAGGGACDTCNAGGPGTTYCSADCTAGAGCEASCGSGSHACCSCPMSCGCCEDIETDRPAAPRGHGGSLR